MPETDTGLGISTFKYIVSKVEDLAIMLDTSVSISSSLADGSHDFRGFKLSIPLRNGYASIELSRSPSKITYYDSANTSSTEAKFQHTLGTDPDDVNRNFDVAFREIMIADKENQQPNIQFKIAPTNSRPGLLKQIDLC
jgi:hypothetical protein